MLNALIMSFAVKSVYSSPWKIRLAIFWLMKFLKELSFEYSLYRHLAQFLQSFYIAGVDSDFSVRGEGGGVHMQK